MTTFYTGDVCCEAITSYNFSNRKALDYETHKSLWVNMDAPTYLPSGSTRFQEELGKADPTFTHRERA